MYASVSDLLAQPGIEAARLVELTDADGTGAIDQAKVEAALRNATGTMDGYIGAIYRLPIAPVPVILVTICCALAYHALWPHSPPEATIKRHNEAMAQLRDIAKGLIKLDAGVETQTARDGMVLVEAEDRTFSRSSLVGF